MTTIHRQPLAGVTQQSANELYIAVPGFFEAHHTRADLRDMRAEFFQSTGSSERTKLAFLIGTQAQDDVECFRFDGHGVNSDLKPLLTATTRKFVNDYGTKPINVLPVDPNVVQGTIVRLCAHPLRTDLTVKELNGLMTQLGQSLRHDFQKPISASSVIGGPTNHEPNEIWLYCPTYN